MIKTGQTHIVIILVLTVLLSTATAYAQEDAQRRFSETRYALAVNGGHSYSPTNEIQFVQGAAIALFDYDRIWPHHAPELLRFKVEGAAGIASTPHARAQISLNMLALYFSDALKTSTMRPYVEAGIGLNYSDYQVDGQGMRINFNPLLGIGSEISFNDGPPWFIACRLHHLSNGGFHSDNRGMNSAVLQVGRFF